MAKLRNFLGPMLRRRALEQIESELAERAQKYPEIESEGSLQGRLASESASINQRAPADDQFDVAGRLSDLVE